jgi:hypothetical protein
MTLQRNLLVVATSGPEIRAPIRGMSRAKSSWAQRGSLPAGSTVAASEGFIRRDRVSPRASI